MKSKLLSPSLIFLLLLILCPACHKTSPVSGKIEDDSIIDLAREAYIFSYPLMIMDATKKLSTNVEQPLETGYAPINQFAHLNAFPDATFKEVVRPNCDTYYSNAWLDLKKEPVVLTIPDTHGRYYLLPMLDAWTNVFASPGKRTIGTKGGNFLITGPGYTGAVPSGLTEIKAPTNTVWIIGRTQVNNRQDGATVVTAIQKGYKLTPLGQFGKNYAPEKNVVDPKMDKTPPPIKVANMDIETYFNKFNELLADNPVRKEDSALMSRLAAIDIGPGRHFRSEKYDTALVRKLEKIPATLQKELLEEAAKMGSIENGWSIKRSGMGSYGTNYSLRAAIALFGLGANLNEDASYPGCRTDTSGQPLTGAKNYVIHFEKGQTPPAKAFWSLTMYGPDDLLVNNQINRYAIGDRDPVIYNKDGSLDILIRHNSPGKGHESNWLPSPGGPFSLTMRIYWPDSSFFNGTWKAPPVKAIDINNPE